MNEIGYLRIILPATIAIAILIYFQYFHQYFIQTLDINRKQVDLSGLHETNIDVETKTMFKRLLETTIIVFHIHLNKLEIMLIAISVMNKVSSFNKFKY